MKIQHNSTNSNERQQNVEVKDLQVTQDPKGGPHIRNFDRSSVQMIEPSIRRTPVRSVGRLFSGSNVFLPWHRG
jgi:hypothetical protein